MNNICYGLDVSHLLQAHVWTPDSQLVVVLGRVVKPLGGGLDESKWISDGWALRRIVKLTWLPIYPVLVWRDVSKQLDTSTATACCHAAFPTTRERTFSPWPAVIPPLGCFLSGVWSLQWKKLRVQHPRSMTLRDHVEIASIWNQTCVYRTQIVTLRARKESPYTMVKHEYLKGRGFSSWSTFSVPSGWTN